MLKEQVYVEQGDGTFGTRNFNVKSLKDFRPFITFENRCAWGGLDSRIIEIIKKNAQAYENFEYPLLKATDFIEYFRGGSRVAYEENYFMRRHALNTLILDYCIEPEKMKLDQIINGIWCICEESSWAVSAHNFIYEPEPINHERTLHDISLPVLDIFAGETGMLLALCYYLLKEELDQVEPLVARRIQSELQRRIITPFLTRYDYWWMGYSDRRDINNWGPWCVMNCLTCILFCEPDDYLRKRGIVRAMDMMDYYLQGINLDGGCDEGATYWGRACGMLLEGLSLVHQATDGEISIYEEKKLIQFTDYIRKMYIGKNYVVNFADGAAKCNPSAEIIYSAGSFMKHELLMEFGAYCYQYQLEHGEFPYLSLTRALASIEKHEEMIKVAKHAKFELDFYIESLEIMVARQYPSGEKGFFLCAKGGGNDDSHNHNDVGNFVCFYDAEPIFIDIGVEVYRKEFFGPHRYDIWTMQSQYHNLPTLGGKMQKEGTDYRASGIAHSYCHGKSILECEIHTAYPEQEAGISYKRTAMLDREHERVQISDFFRSEQEKEVLLHFITPCEISSCEKGLIFQCGKNAVIMEFDKNLFKMKIESIELTDSRLMANWGKQIYRVVLANTGKKAEYCFTIVKG